MIVLFDYADFQKRLHRCSLRNLRNRLLKSVKSFPMPACREGVTLIELLIALSIMGILGGVNAAVLSAGFESWNHAQVRIALQQVANELMEVFLEGGVDGDGIKDAVELRDATLTAISFVPLWTDRSHVPNPVTNKTRQFTLEKQFKAGAATPVGQVRKADSNDWASVSVSFREGSGRNPKQPDDVVTFTDPIPAGASIQILYTPDAEVHPDVQLRFWWNSANHEVYRSYAGKTAPVFKRMQGVNVERLAFLYYDNLNRMLPLGQSYSLDELRRITGVKLYLLLTKTDGWKELTSFTNVRNAQTIGVTISKGSVLPLPSPKEIKAFSVGDFAGLTGNGIVELVVKTGNRSRWRVRVEFKPSAKEDMVVLHRFQMEAPPGTVRTSMILDQPIARNEFVNLLGIDRSGLYDYDDDPDIDDAVLVKGANPSVEVTRLDFEVASLFIRP